MCGLDNTLVGQSQSNTGYKYLHRQFLEVLYDHFSFCHVDSVSGNEIELSMNDICGNRVSREAAQKRLGLGGELGDGGDLLASFVYRGLTMEECEAEIPTLVIAGSDTTAGVVRSGLLHLMTCHRAYQCLQAEIDDAVKTGKASSPITYLEAKELPYLQVPFPVLH